MKSILMRYKAIGFLPGLTQEDFVMPLFKNINNLFYVAYNRDGFFSFREFDFDGNKKIIDFNGNKKYFTESEKYIYFYRYQNTILKIFADDTNSALNMINEDQIDPLQKLSIVDLFKLPKRFELKFIIQAINKINLSILDNPQFLISEVLMRRELFKEAQLVLQTEQSKINKVDEYPRFQNNGWKEVHSYSIGITQLAEHEIKNREAINFSDQERISSWIDRNKNNTELSLRSIKLASRLLRSLPENKKSDLVAFLKIVFNSKILLTNKKSYKFYIQLLNIYSSSNRLFLKLNNATDDITHSYRFYMLAKRIESKNIIRRNIIGLTVKESLRENIIYFQNVIGLFLLNANKSEQEDFKNALVDACIVNKKYEMLHFLLTVF